jgi:agmatine/peptidylarginine deiminase
VHFRRYLHVANFIWLDEAKGVDISDDHIVGTASFANDDTIANFADENFEIRKKYDILAKATHATGEPYKLLR